MLFYALANAFLHARLVLSSQILYSFFMLSEAKWIDSLSPERKQEGGARIMHSETSAPGKSLLQAIGKSFYDSIGDIVFGMEDGTVSIFGLVFGVAASSTSSAPVLLAGATGAVAAAVSMMAGAFLDVQTSKGIARAALVRERKEIEEHPEEEKQEILER